MGDAAERDRVEPRHRVAVLQEGRTIRCARHRTRPLRPRKKTPQLQPLHSEISQHERADQPRTSAEKQPRTSQTRLTGDYLTKYSASQPAAASRASANASVGGNSVKEAEERTRPR